MVLCVTSKYYGKKCKKNWKNKDTPGIGNSAVLKLKTLKQAVKDHNNKTGNGRKQCKFYKELDCILGHRPASTPVTLLDAASAVTETTLDTDSDPDPEEANGIV